MPLSEKQLAANRANAAKSTGPRTPEGKARSARNARTHGFTASNFAVDRLEELDEIARLRQDAIDVYQPVNSQELFALEQLAISQQTMLRAARLESGLMANCLEMALNDDDTAISRWSPISACNGDSSLDNETRAQNRNYALGDGFERMAKQSNAIALLFRYKVQAERLYRRSVEDFNRLKALRAELRNEAILEAHPEENEPDGATPDEPVSTAQPYPQPPASGSTPEEMGQEILPAATTTLGCRPRTGRQSPMPVVRLTPPSRPVSLSGGTSRRAKAGRRRSLPRIASPHELVARTAALFAAQPRCAARRYAQGRKSFRLTSTLARVSY